MVGDKDGPDWARVDFDAVPLTDRAKMSLEAQLNAAAERLRATVSEELDERSSQRGEERDLRTAEAAADTKNLNDLFGTLVSISTSVIDRTRAGAELVQKAASAIAALYVGVLGLVFSVTNNPLPIRGVVTPFFLGVAVALSTAYLAYAQPGVDRVELQATQDLESTVLARISAVSHYASRFAARRSPLLRSSVIALSVGLVCIALPFVGPPSASEPSVRTEAPPWPSPAQASETDLGKILFAAQVSEVANERAYNLKHSMENDTRILAIALGAGTAAVCGPLVIPLIRRGRAKISRRRPPDF